MKILHNKNRTIITSFILVITSLIFILSFLSLSSCRSAEHDNIVSGSGIAAVNINLLGAEYANDKPAQIASIGQNGLIVDKNSQRYSVLVTPSSFISAELTTNTSLNTVASTSNNLNTKAAVSGDQLGTEMKFRAIAYRQSDGSYQTHQDYTIGQSAQPMMLDSGKTYDIIVYSYGVNTLPEISKGEMTNLSQAKIKYDDNNRDLMYQKISGFIPDGNNHNNKLDIKLRHKLNQITVIISTNEFSINRIPLAKLGSHFSDGTFSLSNGIMAYSDISLDENLTFRSQSFPASKIISDPIFINANTENTKTGHLDAYVEINGYLKTLNLPNSFKITPENKSTLTINLRKCWAYVFGSKREFMCHNLGADTSADPFVAVSYIHGNKYQFGASNFESGRFVSQYHDQLTDWKPETGWITSNIDYASHKNDWNSGDEINPIKAGNDPCPGGYRIPTAIEWHSLIYSNSLVYLGTWETSVTNYYTGLKVGDDLYLPAAGYRTREEGWLKWRGSAGLYHSSHAIAYNAGDLSPELLYFERGKTEMQSLDGWEGVNGFPIRCIKIE